MNDQITIDPRICNGKPVISGTRIPVTVVLNQLAETGSVPEVLRRYPELSPDQIKAALQYCHCVIDRMELEPEAASGILRQMQ
jgi:uncharacterized protein (DUF433 family)